MQQPQPFSLEMARELFRRHGVELTGEQLAALAGDLANLARVSALLEEVTLGETEPIVRFPLPANER